MAQKEKGAEREKVADMDFIGFRVPVTLKRSWEERAKKARRSLSNWIVVTVEDALPSSTRPDHGK